MMYRFSFQSAFAALCFTATTAFSWGQTGHQMVNRVAIEMVNHRQGRQFLETNSKEVIRFASTPDTRWKSGPSAQIEKPLHWFEIDGYTPTGLGEGIADLMFGDATQQLGQDTVKKYGMALWRVSQLYGLLVEALKAEKWEQALQVAGVMGHYVGDLTQPMHLSVDYDGQSINKPGIHKYYETTLVDKINSQHLYDVVVPVAGERRMGLERAIGNDMNTNELQHVTYDQAEEGFLALEQIIEQFDRHDTDDKWLQEDLKPRIAYASALLGKIWDVALVTSGAEKFPRASIDAKEPAWIPMK